MAFNDQQLEAINCNDRTILCLAGAGAGKSTTMVNRLKRLVDEGANPKSLLALTFTNAAAFEMGEKYRKLPGVHGDTPEFRTFHSFCYSLIIKDKAIRNRLGYQKVPTICDDNKIKLLQSQAQEQVGSNFSENELKHPELLSKQDQYTFAIYTKALTKLIREENVITFDMLCYNVCELFVRNELEAIKYKKKYTCICVDEFQDSDTVQYRFVASFPETTSIFLCGDALQNIYAFRGCHNTFIKQLCQDPNWKVIKLYKNYRSTNQICEFANKMSTYASTKYRIEMEGFRDGDDVKVIYGSHTSYTEPVDSAHLAQVIKMIEHNDEDCAILCRTNKEVKAVCNALKAKDIPFNTSNRTGDAVDILNSVLDNTYMLNWLSTLLDSVEYGDFIRLSSLEENPDIRWFLRTYGKHAKIREYGHQIIDIRRIMNSEDAPAKKFNTIAKMLKIKTRCAFDATLEYDNKTLVENLRDQVTALNEANVYVGTIHSSKGLEYTSVYVMGVDDKMFKLDDEDMLNLYYVAITRAKDHLTVFRA